MIGKRARFFHPMTLGIMHWGVVVKEEVDFVRVKFDYYGTYWTIFSGRVDNATRKRIF